MSESNDKCYICYNYKVNCTCLRKEPVEPDHSEPTPYEDLAELMDMSEVDDVLVEQIDDILYEMYVDGLYTTIEELK